MIQLEGYPLKLTSLFIVNLPQVYYTDGSEALRHIALLMSWFFPFIMAIAFLASNIHSSSVV